MSRTGHVFLLTVAALSGALTACTTMPQARSMVIVEDDPEPEPFIDTAWRQVISAADGDRLTRTAAAWDAGLAEARTAGFAEEIDEEGPLLDPDVALPRAAPPPGSYRCRVVTLGRIGRRGRAFATYKPFFCHVDAEEKLLIMTKQTGSERPAGRIWEDSDTRHIFLGAMVLDDERVPNAYGDDPARDLAGIVERVAPFRYRIVFPWSNKGSKIDVYELVPATPFPDDE